jgi:pilus assembly protein CpaE
MAGLSVVVIAPDNEQRTVLQAMVELTSVAKVVHACGGFPVASADAIMRRVESASPDVILLDIPPENPLQALRGVELLHQAMPETAVVVIGSLTQPQVIVNSMRAGAREFLERPTTTGDLLEAFVRLSAKQRSARRDENRAGIFTVLNAKGGSGATTVAVNLALALQAAHGNVALVDIAQLGHAALHLNLKPAFTVSDAVRNLHRLDRSLLESFMTRHSGGLQLLAGNLLPMPVEPSTAEFARLFDLLGGTYRYVVVDASSRLDATTRLVCNLSRTVLMVATADLAGIWSAPRIQEHLGDTGSKDKFQLILNRFRKNPSFRENDVEAASGLKILWKIPNQYFVVSTAIDRGVPVVGQSHGELARAFSGLASRLTQDDPDVKRESWSLFKSVERA